MTYCQQVGARRDSPLCDGEIEFNNRRVRHPVSSPFTLVFGVLWVEGQQWLVVSIEIDGTQEDLQVHYLRSTVHLDVWRS